MRLRYARCRKCGQIWVFDELEGPGVCVLCVRTEAVGRIATAAGEANDAIGYFGLALEAVKHRTKREGELGDPHRPLPKSFKASRVPRSLEAWCGKVYDKEAKR